MRKGTDSVLDEMKGKYPEKLAAEESIFSHPSGGLGDAGRF